MESNVKITGTIGRKKGQISSMEGTERERMKRTTERGKGKESGECKKKRLGRLKIEKDGRKIEYGRNK
jgi:hypothetical protein